MHSRQTPPLEDVPTGASRADAGDPGRAAEAYLRSIQEASRAGRVRVAPTTLVLAVGGSVDMLRADADAL